MNSPRLLESDAFPFEFISEIAERESWRKEIHRPIYHMHKWWAKRLGSVFRGILLAAEMDDSSDLEVEFYRRHDFGESSVLDVFMGSGTTIGEAHKLGFTALGRDINPVAVESVQVAMGPMDGAALDAAFKALDAGVGKRVRALYRAEDDRGEDCDVLYHFWVMQAPCPSCDETVDLFSSYVFAQHAYAKVHPEVQVVCPHCASVFEGRHGRSDEECPACQRHFDPRVGPAQGQSGTCQACGAAFPILKAVGGLVRPTYRLYAKLILTKDGKKRYLAATDADRTDYAAASALLDAEVAAGRITLPDLALEEGYNTAQAMRYGFLNWRDFFNDRQLLALGWLHAEIRAIADPAVREVLLTIASGLLEFNNLFASYKGEGTGAVRHMFSHHILKPERSPIEANVWGTPKSSGSFSGLYKTRLHRALAYRAAPTEVKGGNGEKSEVASPPFTGAVLAWPSATPFRRRGLYLSCGDSAFLGLPDKSVDLCITDPPFFDNVHYSELADFFHAWHQIGADGPAQSTRNEAEVQDTDPGEFGKKLRAVFAECHRVLKDDAILAFTYHHARAEGWHPLAKAVLGAGFVIVQSQPVKAEMSVGTPLTAAKDPISFDIIIVCRKATATHRAVSREQAISTTRGQLARLAKAGFALSKNDRKVIEFGQLLRTVANAGDALDLADRAETELEAVTEALRGAA